MKKFVSTLLVTVMAVSLFAVNASASSTTYSDVQGHWAQNAIVRWSDYGVLQGDNGQFVPNGTLTRAQMAAILSRLLNLPAAPSAGFTDVAPDAWYADCINRCAAAKIMLGTDGKAMPDAPITREQAMVMLCRALGLEPVSESALGGFADIAKVSPYARGYVAALVRAGIVRGDVDNLLNPVNDISRAEIVTMIDRLVVHYGCENGAVIDASDGGLVVVTAKNVKVINAPEGTKVVVADEATGLTVNNVAISDDLTYIVPGKQDNKPSQPSTPSTPSVPSHYHSWGAAVVTKAATCTETGIVTYTCAVCGAMKNETIPATGHTVVTDAAVTATCTETGLTEGAHCSVCNTVLTAQTTIPATGHNWEVTDVTYAAKGVNGSKTTTCATCGTTETKDINWKFYLSAASGATVDMTVGEDYTAVFTLPTENKNVDAAGVALTAKMQNVSSLGVGALREHTVNITTGITGVSADLGTWLSNCYGFQGMTVNAAIGGQNCTYTFSACENGVITAATDTEAARAAWQVLTSYVSTTGQTADDSYILVKNGSTLQIGKELLSFEKAEDLKLDNFSDISALKKNVQEHVKLDTNAEEVSGIVINLKAGTQLAVGQSIATLSKDVTVTVTGIDMSSSTLLSDLRAMASQEGVTSKQMVLAAVNMFNGLVGQMNGRIINVTVQ